MSDVKQTQPHYLLEKKVKLKVSEETSKACMKVFQNTSCEVRRQSVEWVQCTVEGSASLWVVILNPGIW